MHLLFAQSKQDGFWWFQSFCKIYFWSKKYKFKTKNLLAFLILLTNENMLDLFDGNKGNSYE